MSNLDDVLKKKLKGMGIDRQVEAAGVVEAAQKEIAKFIPEEDFEVVSFNRGTLKVRTVSSSASNEVLLSESKIKNRLKISHLKLVN